MSTRSPRRPSSLPCTRSSGRSSRPRSERSPIMTVANETKLNVTESADADLGRRARQLRMPASLPIYLGRIAIVAVILVFWHLASGCLLPKYLISSPSDGATRLYDLFKSGSVWGDLGIT